MKLVLDHGADLGFRGGMYHSAMRCAVFCGNTSAAHALLERGAEVDDDIFLLAVEVERETVIPLLLQRGVDVNAQNKEGTALQLAIANHDESTTKTLLQDPSIDITARGGNDGGTALLRAVRTGN